MESGSTEIVKAINKMLAVFRKSLRQGETASQQDIDDDAMLRLTNNRINMQFSLGKTGAALGTLTESATGERIRPL